MGCCSSAPATTPPPPAAIGLSAVELGAYEPSSPFLLSIPDAVAQFHSTFPPCSLSSLQQQRRRVLGHSSGGRPGRVAHTATSVRVRRGRRDEGCDAGQRRTAALVHRQARRSVHLRRQRRSLRRAPSSASTSRTASSQQSRRQPAPTTHSPPHPRHPTPSTRPSPPVASRLHPTAAAAWQQSTPTRPSSSRFASPTAHSPTYHSHCRRPLHSLSFVHWSRSE